MPSPPFSLGRFRLHPAAKRRRALETDSPLVSAETRFVYKKEIPFLAKFEIENKLIGFVSFLLSLSLSLSRFPSDTAPPPHRYDKKWLYIETSFVSPPHPKTGLRKIYARSLSNLVMKHNRRTIPPARAFALAGYDSDHGFGKENAEIVKGLSAKEKLKWLVGEDGGKGAGIRVGSESRGMDVKDWPGSD